MTAVNTHKCPGCGAPVAGGTQQCEYCGAWLKTPPTSNTPALHTASTAGEFGLRGGAPFVVGVVGAVLLYSLGWMFEDTRYWLEDEAVAIWAVALPIWLCLIGSLV